MKVKNFKALASAVVLAAALMAKALPLFQAMQVKVDRVNGLTPEESKHKIMFENLTPLFPKEQFRLERDIKSDENITSRIVDQIDEQILEFGARVGRRPVRG